jgi:hypothetical protein
MATESTENTERLKTEKIPVLKPIERQVELCHTEFNPGCLNVFQLNFFSLRSLRLCGEICFSVDSVDSVAIMFLRPKEKAPPVEAGPFGVLR